MTEQDRENEAYWERQEQARLEESAREAEYEEACWAVAAAPLPVMDPNGRSRT